MEAKMSEFESRLVKVEDEILLHKDKLSKSWAIGSRNKSSLQAQAEVKPMGF